MGTTKSWADTDFKGGESALCTHPGQPFCHGLSSWQSVSSLLRAPLVAGFPKGSAHFTLLSQDSQIGCYYWLLSLFSRLRAKIKSTSLLLLSFFRQALYLPQIQWNEHLSAERHSAYLKKVSRNTITWWWVQWDTRPLFAGCFRELPGTAMALLLPKQQRFVGA